MIDVRRSPEIQATLLAVKGATKDLRSTMNADARRELGSRWTPALGRRASTQLERAVILKGARVKVGTDGFRLLAAQSNRLLSGGFWPAGQWYAVEFGARTRRVTIATHSRNGRPYNVTKVINRQLPSRMSDGQIAMDAASELGTELVGVWVHSIVDTTIRAAAPAGAEEVNVSG